MTRETAYVRCRVCGRDTDPTKPRTMSVKINQYALGNRAAKRATLSFGQSGRWRPRHARNAPSAMFFGLVLVSLPAGALALDDNWALTVFAGRLTAVGAWHDIVTDPGGTDFVGSYFIAGALSRSLASFWYGGLGLELEGQVVRHWGDQDLWEFNLPLVARWHRFPWNTRVATTAAFGLGPSYTTKVPAVEVELEGESERFLVHWFLEFTLAPSESSWAVALRLQHRSASFGLLGDEASVSSIS